MAKKEWIHSPKKLPAPLASEKKIIALTNSSPRLPLKGQIPLRWDTGPQMVWRRKVPK